MSVWSWRSGYFGKKAAEEEADAEEKVEAKNGNEFIY